MSPRRGEGRPGDVQFRTDVFNAQADREGRQSTQRSGEVVGKGLAEAGGAIGAGMAAGQRLDFERDKFQMQFDASQEALEFREQLAMAELSRRESDSISRRATDEAKRNLILQQTELIGAKAQADLLKKQVEQADLQLEATREGMAQQKEEYEYGVSQRDAIGPKEYGLMGQALANNVPMNMQGGKITLLQSIGASQQQRGAQAGPQQPTMSGFGGRPVPQPTPSLYGETTPEKAEALLPFQGEEFPDVSNGQYPEIAKFAEVAVSRMSSNSKVAAVNALRKHGFGPEHLVDATTALIFSSVQYARSKGINWPIDVLARQAISSASLQWDAALKWYVKTHLKQQGNGQLPQTLQPPKPSSGSKHRVTFPKK